MNKIDIELLFANLIINIQQREDTLYHLRASDTDDIQELNKVSQQYTELTLATQNIIDQIREQVNAVSKQQMVNDIVNKF